MTLRGIILADAQGYTASALPESGADEALFILPTLHHAVTPLLPSNTHKSTFAALSTLSRKDQSMRNSKEWKGTLKDKPVTPHSAHPSSPEDARKETKAGSFFFSVFVFVCLFVTEFRYALELIR